MIPAGSFDRRIEVQRVAITRDAGTNATLENWSTHIASVPAMVRQSPGREFLADDKVTSERRILFTVRGADITTLDRVLFEGATFNISDVRGLYRNRFLELQCEAVK